MEIAIVGMGCRYPDSPDLLTFWQNCLDRRVCLSELTDQRWVHDTVYDPDRRKRNKTHTRAAGLVAGLELFAARHFQVPPRRARSMDPQQRLILEVAREALQDAGCERRPFERERSGVFLGASIAEYATYSNLLVRSQQLKGGEFGHPTGVDVSVNLPDANAYSLSGCLMNVVATNVAHYFKLGGPAFTSDAACASSLVAVTQACQYLRNLPPRNGISPVALAGGVYLMFLPDNCVGFGKGSALAERECRPFDARADGFILGEGAGVVVLKRLEDALADEDRIYAVIKGAVWGNDAGTSSPMTPSQAGQARLLRWGLESSGLRPEQLGYLECQGTGAPSGDEVELAALSEVWSGSRRPVLGSIKANFGHTLTAAGAAGLLRASMALHTRTFPPQAAWESWHPKLEAMSETFQILTKPQPWEGYPAASVSAFGFGGTNCFVVLEAAPPTAPKTSTGSLFCPVSAPSLSLLKDHLSQLLAILEVQDPRAVSGALQLRAPQEWTLLSRGSDRDSLHKIFRQVGELETPELVSTSGYLLGPTEELKTSQADGWETELTWLRGESPPGPLSPPCYLPPSPLERKPYWPVDKRPG